MKRLKHRESRPELHSNRTWCWNPTQRTGRPRFCACPPPRPTRRQCSSRSGRGRGRGRAHAFSGRDSTRPPEGAKSSLPIRGLSIPGRSTRWQQRAGCVWLLRSGACPRHRGGCVGLLPAAPPSLGWGRGDRASPTLSSGRPWRSVSNPPAPEDPKHPQRPLMRT